MASGDQIVLVLMLGITGALEEGMEDLAVILGNVKVEAITSWCDPISG